MKCDACPVTSGACHGATGERPHFCAMAAAGGPATMMLIRDVSGGNVAAAPKPALPGLFRMARAFAGAAARHVATMITTRSTATVGDEVYEARLRVCETSGPGGGKCPNLLLPDWRCAGMEGCGCYLKVKARWLESACPLNLWDK